MKDLEIKLSKNGFDYNQVFKNQIGYIYCQKIKNTNTILGYEVFKRVENNYFDCVSFPGNEAFGFWAKSCHSIERCMFHLKYWAENKEVVNE